jgi:hypothetical protein
MLRKLIAFCFVLLIGLSVSAQVQDVKAYINRSNDVNIEWFVSAYGSIVVSVEHSIDSFRTLPSTIYTSDGPCEGGQYGQSFSYKHSSPIEGDNYYRLNLDGYSYTPIIRVQVTGAPHALKLAPNPFNPRTRVTVQNNGVMYDVIILDLKGNIIRKIENNWYSDFWLERDLLHQGIYYLVLTDYRNFFTYAKFVVRDDY